MARLWHDDEEGYLADYQELPDDTQRPTLHSCAIRGVASRYGQACTAELRFHRDVLAEAEVERVTHKVPGAYVCGYEIRPAQAKRRSSARQAGPAVPQADWRHVLGALVAPPPPGVRGARVIGRATTARAWQRGGP
jgi:hypothetical protein